MHLLCTYMFLHCTYILKNAFRITSTITLLTHPLPLNLPIPPNLSQTLPVSHLSSSKRVLQYNMNTTTLYIVFIFW